MTATTDGERKALPCLLIHGDPHALLVRFFRHKAPGLIRFHLQTSKDHVSWNRDRSHMQMIRQRRTACLHKAYGPADTDAHSPANAMQRDFLAASAFHQGALFVPDHPMGRVEDKLATARLTLVTLLPGMNVTMSLESLSTTGWTRFPRDYSVPLHP